MVATSSQVRVQGISVQPPIWTSQQYHLQGSIQSCDSLMTTLSWTHLLTTMPCTSATQKKIQVQHVVSIPSGDYSRMFSFFAQFELPGSPPNIRWGIPDGLTKSHQGRHNINKSHTRRETTFGGLNHVRGKPHLNPHLSGRRQIIQMSLLRGTPYMSPTCNQKRSLEREISSWKLPVTFVFELCGDFALGLQWFVS